MVRTGRCPASPDRIFEVTPLWPAHVGGPRTSAPAHDSAFTRAGVVHISTKLHSVANALAILEMLADQGELSLVEIADRLDVAPSTAHRLLATLSDMEFVQRDPLTKRYGVSLKVFRIGISGIERLGLAHVALPEMTRLNAISNETVSLAVPSGTEMMYIERVEAQQAIKSDYPLGHSAPMYCTALGKAYLSGLSPAELSVLLGKMTIRPVTPHTVADRRALEEQLQAIRMSGYAIDDRELDENLRCVAAPVFDRRNRPIAAISIAGPAFRITVAKLHEWGAAAREAANAISRAIGWVG